MNKKNQLMLNPLSLSIGILTFVNSVYIYIYIYIIFIFLRARERIVHMTHEYFIFIF